MTADVHDIATGKRVAKKRARKVAARKEPKPLTDVEARDMLARLARRDAEIVLSEIQEQLDWLDAHEHLLAPADIGQFRWALCIIRNTRDCAERGICREL